MNILSFTIFSLLSLSGLFSAIIFFIHGNISSIDKCEYAKNLCLLEITCISLAFSVLWILEFIYHWKSSNIVVNDPCTIFVTFITIIYCLGAMFPIGIAVNCDFSMYPHSFIQNTLIANIPVLAIVFIILFFLSIKNGCFLGQTY